MKFLIIALGLSSMVFGQVEEPVKVKSSLGEKISVVARGLKYLSSPTLSGQLRMQKITTTQAYKNWLKDIKYLTDEIYGTQKSDNTQFGHAIALISERLENDKQAMSGYMSSGKMNKNYLKREKELLNDLSAEKEFSTVYDSLKADANGPLVRSLGPIYAYNMNYSNGDLNHLDRHQNLREVLNDNERIDQSCQAVCPLNYGLLRINRAPIKIVYGDARTQEDFTTFRNKPEDFNQYIKKQFGFCWGHSSLLYKFKRYAIFRPNLTRDSANVLKLQIQSLIRNEAMVEFNGYKSLWDLSDSNEEVKVILMSEVAREWARSALTIRNIISLQSAVKAMKQKEYVAFYNNVLKRILSNQLVQIKFNAHKVSGWSHIVNAYAVEEKEDEYRIYVQDPNTFPNDVPAENSPGVNNFIAIKKTPAVDGKGFAYYSPLKDVPSLKGEVRVGLTEITPEGRMMALQTVEKYQAVCEQITRCQK